MRRHAGYEPVDQYEEQSELQRRLAAEQRRKDQISKISARIHALFWVVASFFTAKYSEVFTVAFHDSRVYTIVLGLGIACTVVATIVFLYLSCYLSYIKRVESWEVASPKGIPTLTLFGSLAILLYTIALWPVYGFLTPVIVGVLTFGMIFFTVLVPLP